MHLIPFSKEYSSLSGKFVLQDDSQIFCHPIFRDVVQGFIDEINGLGKNVQLTQDYEKATILFCLPAEDVRLSDQGYNVACSEHLLSVYTSSQQGAFYAIQTLRQLFCLDEGSDQLVCDACEIRDNPKYQWRGLELDIARHFFDKETIKKVINLMAKIKLNKLFLHVSDDQGYRLESEKFPLLNSVGSCRQGSEVHEKGRRYVDQVPVCGYLTKQDVKELVEYASARFVDVVPKINVPGHSLAILASYPHLGCQGAYKVAQTWNTTKDALCAGDDQTYEFLESLLDEITSMFSSDYVHLCNTNFNKERWHNCKKCQEKMSQLKLRDEDHLQKHFFNHFVDYLAQKGKTVLCDNDAPCTLPEQVVCQHWSRIRSHATKRHVKNGGQVLLSDYRRFSLDFPHKVLSAKKVYKFRATKFIKDKSLILGKICRLSTEYVNDQYKLFYNLFPRLWAFSENAWGTNNNYASFVKRAKEMEHVYQNKQIVFARDVLSKRSGVSKTEIKKFLLSPNDEVNKSKNV